MDKQALLYNMALATLVKEAMLPQGITEEEIKRITEPGDIPRIAAAASFLPIFSSPVSWGTLGGGVHAGNVAHRLGRSSIVEGAKGAGKMFGHGLARGVGHSLLGMAPGLGIWGLMHGLATLAGASDDVLLGLAGTGAGLGLLGGIGAGIHGAYTGHRDAHMRTLRGLRDSALEELEARQRGQGVEGIRNV